MLVAVDSGGTFTDCVYLHDGVLAIRKVLSTPEDPGAAVLQVATQATGLAAAGTELRSLRHGTTVGTNAMLERKGARVAFVTTAGFEDTIAIGRQARRSLYDWFDTPPPCLVPKELRFGVPERTSAQGTVLRAPTPSELDALCDAIESSGAEAIALSLLFSFANPVNELSVARALARLQLPLSVSSRLLPEFREFERASTLVVNAYLAPKVGAYLNLLDRSLAQSFDGAALEVLQSSGGILPAALAAQEPVRTLLSGPAGGVIGAHRVGALAGFQKIITFDMGGTSTDVALISGAEHSGESSTPEAGLRITNETVVAEMPVAVPMLDIHTVGAGGGSIARFDAGGILHVGPESAGSEPGPICYGRGEQPTVTDANLLLGRLDPENFLGGAMQLDEERMRRHMQQAADAMEPGRASVEAFAAATVLLAEASMERAIRVISVERGYDPREFTLVCFGGAGPLHACALAHSLAMRRVLVPLMPGALSALGILLADTVRDYSKTVMQTYTQESSPDLLKDALNALEAQGQADFAHASVSPVFIRSLDMRYAGQGFEVNVTAGADLLLRFHETHRKRYGYADPDRQVEIVNVRVRAVAASGEVSLATQTYAAGNGSQAFEKMRRVYFDGIFVETPVFAREQLRHGDCVAGPALITEYSSTTVIPPGDRMHVDRFGNLVIDIQQLIEPEVQP